MNFFNLVHHPSKQQKNFMDHLMVATFYLALSFILLFPYPTIAHAQDIETLTSDLLLTGSISHKNKENETNASDQKDHDSDANNANNHDTDTVTITTDKPINAESSSAKDDDIRQRILGIFSEIDGLKDIHVAVNQGVATLSGDVPNEKKAQQAINLANRISNVVAVNDNINRTLAVEDNVTPVIKTIKGKIDRLIKALPLLLMALVVFLCITALGSWVSNRHAFWNKITPNPFVAELLAQTVKVIFIIVGLILALSLMGAEAIIGTLLGGAGVIGIAVGFAVKDTIENYISSLMLSIRQPFRARDQVVINGQEGIVVRLTSRATILMTLDGNQLRIPNSEVFKGTILNYTKNPERRFTFKLGVDANDDPIAAIKVGLDAINDLDFVLTEPKAVAIIDEVGDSNIVLEFQVWVNQAKTDFSKARSITIRETKHALENQGFSLPEPIYRLRFDPKVEQNLQQLIPAKTATPSQPDEPKAQAKARAKQILTDEKSIQDILDARPDPKLMQKVEEEIAESGERDLLNQNSPQE